MAIWKFCDWLDGKKVKWNTYSTKEPCDFGYENCHFVGLQTKVDVAMTRGKVYMNITYVLSTPQKMNELIFLSLKKIIELIFI